MRGVGYVEGFSYNPEHAPGGVRPVPVVRWASGVVSWHEPSELVAVELGTVLTEDVHNNVGRLCMVPLYLVGAGEEGRTWRLVSAVSGNRYLVVNLRTGRVLVLEHRSLTNLY
jgi:hypothetical protein